MHEFQGNRAQGHRGAMSTVFAYLLRFWSFNIILQHATSVRNADKDRYWVVWISQLISVRQNIIIHCYLGERLRDNHTLQQWLLINSHRTAQAASNTRLKCTIFTIFIYYLFTIFERAAAVPANHNVFFFGVNGVDSCLILAYFTAPQSRVFSFEFVIIVAVFGAGEQLKIKICKHRIIRSTIYDPSSRYVN